MPRHARFVTDEMRVVDFLRWLFRSPRLDPLGPKHHAHRVRWFL